MCFVLDDGWSSELCAEDVDAEDDLIDSGSWGGILEFPAFQAGLAFGAVASFDAVGLKFDSPLSSWRYDVGSVGEFRPRFLHRGSYQWWGCDGIDGQESEDNANVLHLYIKRILDTCEYCF